ncbi:MAG: DUF177 domain-containing protein [Balneolales bacterium]|nr:DUF177 domain-containing protein [Balneolales bacterium]
MFKFKIFEIPEGKSTRALSLTSDDLDLGEIKLNTGSVNIDFDRTSQFIRSVLVLDVMVELVCDRSLDVFDFVVNQSYEILFKFDMVEESADEQGAIRNIDHASKQIDIGQDVRDTILVNLPAKKLHPRFLDDEGNPVDFLEQKFGEASDDKEEVMDPRWAALKQLKK